MTNESTCFLTLAPFHVKTSLVLFPHPGAPHGIYKHTLYHPGRNSVVCPCTLLDLIPGLRSVSQHQAMILGIESFFSQELTAEICLYLVSHFAVHQFSG